MGNALFGFEPSASPRLRVKQFFGSLLVAVMSIGAARTVLAQARAETAEITITARTPNAVHVDERYVLRLAPQALEFRIMTKPCMRVENLRVEGNGVVLMGSESLVGPWIMWRDTTFAPGDSLRLSVRYTVWLGGSRTIPLMHLTAPLARNESSRLGAVTIALRFAHSGGEVEFPYMTRQAPNEWSGRYVAVPSFLKVGGPAFPCDRPPDVAGDNGGLVWRYWLLLGIMVAWVPIYLTWARRTGERA